MRHAQAAGSAEPEELSRSLRDAARTAYLIRLRHVREGMETPDAALNDLVKLAAADSALAKTPAERVAAAERYWAVRREVEEMTVERVAAGIVRFGPADYWANRTERLLAELNLVREFAAAGRPSPGSVHSALHDPDPLEEWGPRVEFLAAHEAPRKFIEAAFEACANEQLWRIRRVMGGAAPPSELFSPLLSRLRVEQAAGRVPAASLAAVEAVWMLNRDEERLMLERVEAGIQAFTPADYHEARDHQLEAAIRVAEARRRAGKPLPLTGGLQERLAEVLHAPLDTKEVARAKSEAVRADVRRLARERREAILAGNECRRYFASATSERLLDAELALAGSKAERLAALERHWSRVAAIEVSVRESVETRLKTFTAADFWEARYDTLLAELLLAEARAARE
jgi:hypothetical protein